MYAFSYKNMVSAIKSLTFVILFVFANFAFSEGGSVQSPALVFPQFEFENSTIGGIDQDTFKGKAQIVFFGFMSCPDICPVTLSNVSRALKRIQHSDDDVRVLFISVDRHRDTIEGLRAYLKEFSPKIIGVTGTSAETRKAATAFRAPYNLIRKEDGEVEVRHSGFIYFVNREGGLHAKLPYNSSIDRIAEEIQVVMR